MVELIKPAAEAAAALLELLGMAVIVAMALYGLGYALWNLVRGAAGLNIFRSTRHRLARGILLGLEFLVAGDIIRTVAIKLTWTSVGVLAVIVAIRTFLSFTLEVEISGNWPWQKQVENGQRKMA
jgi:uncharacterized membrane protein